MTYETKVVNAMFSLMYNTSADNMMRLAYHADTHPNYLAEKMATYIRSPAAWWGRLDTQNQNRLVDFACEKYQVFKTSGDSPHSQPDAVTP
tara:strand:+ start:5984 stop:6256 length:273 start_codon:yes stop_codon:yes gene_type:complete